MATKFETDSRKNFDLEVVIEALEQCLQSDGSVLLSYYLQAYHELCRFFRLTGRLFGFVARDLEYKIRIVETHRESKNGAHYRTAQSTLDFEVANHITKVKGHPPSASRTLLRLHWALEFILAFMREIRSSPDSARSSKIAADVYSRTLAHHHPWLVQKMAMVAVYMLPSKRQLVEVMCKHEYAQVMELLDRVVDLGQPIYDSTEKAYAEKGLLKLS